MSLINDLLCDLERRKAVTSGTDALADLQPVSRLPAARGRRWLLPLAAALLASSAFAVLHIDTDRSYEQPTSVVPVAVVEADAATDVVSDNRLATLVEFTRSLDELPSREVRRPPAQTSQAIAAPALLSRKLTQPPAEKASSERPAAVAAVRTHTDDANKTPVSVTIDNARRDGLAALAAGRQRVAEERFRVLVERQPEAADGWLYLARSLSAQGNNLAAEKLLGEALAAATETAPLARALARHMLARQATAEALQLLEAYRPRESMDPDHDAFIAAVQQRLGRHDIAAERYRGVLAVRPEAAAWWVGLAISEEARGRGQAALDAYRHARNIGNLDTRLADYADQRIAAMQGRDQS